MRIAGTIPCSFVNGDGARYVVFTQGCVHHCPGCQNQETWDAQGGIEMSVLDIARDYQGHRLLDGITLSGGDPFLQQEECLALLDLLPGVNVWIYTGYEYEEIADTELAKRADVLVVGPYVSDLRCEGKMYGSSNQRIIRRVDRDRDAAGKLCCDECRYFKHCRATDICTHPGGLRRPGRDSWCSFGERR